MGPKMEANIEQKSIKTWFKKITFFLQVLGTDMGFMKMVFGLQWMCVVILELVYDTYYYGLNGSCTL